MEIVTMEQNYRYHYEIQINIEALKAKDKNLAKIAFDDTDSPFLYFDTNTRLVKGELLETSIRNISIALEITRIIRYSIKCNNGTYLEDTSPLSEKLTEESWFTCKANAFINLD